jgi:hypothetical protein
MRPDHLASNARHSWWNNHNLANGQVLPDNALIRSAELGQRYAVGVGYRPAGVALLYRVTATGAAWDGRYRGG